MSSYVHFASRLTGKSILRCQVEPGPNITAGWNAIKSRAAQLNIDITDAQYKECTAKIKALADIRPIAIDDADSIIRAFHRSIKLGQEIDLLPNMTDAERAAFAKKEQEIAIPEKRALDEEARLPGAKKAKDAKDAVAA
jgi:homocitrate synthase